MALIAIVCEIFTLITFFYQRTLRVLAMRLGIDQKALVFLYPKYMLVLYWISYLKWLCYAYLLFVNWIAALIIWGVSFAVSVLYRASDLKNLLTIRQRLKDSFNDIPNEVYETILREIDSGLVRMQYNLFGLEEYNIVKKFYSSPDTALATSMILKHQQFKSIDHAIIHITIIREYIDATSEYAEP